MDPKRIIYYFCTHLRMSFQPSFCIDISDQIDIKMQACACYESQGLGADGGSSEMVKTICCILRRTGSARSTPSRFTRTKCWVSAGWIRWSFKDDDERRRE